MQAPYGSNRRLKSASTHRVTGQAGAGWAAKNAQISSVASSASDGGSIPTRLASAGRFFTDPGH